jgi:hypothetical protein
MPPWPRRISVWSERWRDTTERLTELERLLREVRAVVLRGGPYDRWDLEVRGGTSGGVRLRMCVEEHGAGRQLVHFRLWPQASRLGGPLAAVPMFLAILAALDGAWVASGALGAVAGFFLFRVIRQCGTAMTELLDKLQRPDLEELMMADREELVVVPGSPPSPKPSHEVRQVGGAV